MICQEADRCGTCGLGKDREGGRCILVMMGSEFINLTGIMVFSVYTPDNTVYLRVYIMPSGQIGIVRVFDQVFMRGIGIHGSHQSKWKI
jgi:hypothetical protein